LTSIRPSYLFLCARSPSVVVAIDVEGIYMQVSLLLQWIEVRCCTLA
jgi:hypothetical protein